MKAKHLWLIIFGLAAANVLFISLLISEKSVPASAQFSDQEIVASMDNDSISRGAWLQELEDMYGKETLEEMISIRVVRSLAKKYSIEVPEEEIEREYNVIYDFYRDTDSSLQLDNLREQIEYSILLEELLTKDVEIPEAELKEFYENHRSSYEDRHFYHLSHIVLHTKEEAETAISELKRGSGFSVLAKEKSTDGSTAGKGGDMGYAAAEKLPEEYLRAIKSLEDGEFTVTPVETSEGFAVVMLNEERKAGSTTFQEARSRIRREIALQQMDGNMDAKKLWEESGVSWLYGESK
ncbi:peptidylprolyl isomerase [Bacillus lacus]|uniref:peptidylprolyl isomerase n=1 Tax=Metabacillus lacus TaxID=1983721 RepID=A0A7X2J043_9BACI|nr:peptidyl-prolyl cis-trans isomerase [Metabacillus lacus]MRX72976.1 peptidylprolyl isomerase [Metabacillus lacus]